MSDRAASRYIKSLLGLAVEKGLLEDVHKDMQLISKTCKENKTFAAMLKSPVIRHEKKFNILEKIFKGRVNEMTRGFIELITLKNREPILQVIASEFHNAYNEYKGIEKATVTTTITVDAKLKGEIEAIVKKLSTKKQVELVEKIDKDLIGGFVLNVGDRQIDASIKNKLKSLKVKFAENPYIKEF